MTKDTVPNDAQDFAFNPSAGVNADVNFFLDDDADATVPNSRSFTVTPGTHTVEELTQAGFTLSGIICVDPASNSTVLGSVATYVVAAGETVTCTFTNIPTPADPPVVIPTPVVPATDVVSQVAQQPTQPPATDTLTVANVPAPQLSPATTPVPTPAPAGELPRTGAAGTREATLLALGLVVIGMSTRAIGRRRGHLTGS